MAHEHVVDYFTARGLQSAAPESLNTALRLVLDTMPTLLYGEPSDELTAEEQAILKAGGIDLDTIIENDPLAKTAVKFAAIIENSLTIKETAKQLNKGDSQIRQMTARRTLYSILLDNRRFIPIFQFKKDGAMIPQMTKVNAALRPDLHPVEVFEWFTEAEPNLTINDDIEQTVSPIAWLNSAQNYRTVVKLAKQL